MTSALDKKLCELYPEIFQDRHGNMMDTAMCWGFDCDDGWYTIIDDLCGSIMTLSKEVPVATQVKEKFGGLRFYVHSANEIVYDLIDKAEKKSEQICEKCGESGMLTEKGMWVKTLCEKCAKDLEYVFMA